LLKHLTEKMKGWESTVADYLQMVQFVKECDAYIATGSNNSARYFEKYFGNKPHIIRRNRTSVAVLTGEEDPEQLQLLADDVYSYFGLGCRNVTKLFVPVNYDFIPLLEAFRKYDHLQDHNKYRNNYEYNLAVLILNNKYYMTNGTILLVEDPSFFSRISQLHYEFYSDADAVVNSLKGNEDVQALIGYGGLPFGSAQCPSINIFADGVDTMNFLKELHG
jgi:hypothetical protein